VTTEIETAAVPHVAMTHVVHHAALPAVPLVVHVVMIDFPNAKKNLRFQLK